VPVGELLPLPEGGVADPLGRIASLVASLDDLAFSSGYSLADLVLTAVSSGCLLWGRTGAALPAWADRTVIALDRRPSPLAPSDIDFRQATR
jgi:hypothetical protein